MQCSTCEITYRLILASHLQFHETIDCLYYNQNQQYFTTAKSTTTLIGPITIHCSALSCTCIVSGALKPSLSLSLSDAVQKLATCEASRFDWNRPCLHAHCSS